MTDLTQPKEIITLLRQHGFHMKKSLGQNFLIDKNILEHIMQITGLQGQEMVLEIGPGIGTLTQQLAKAAYRVVAVELDHKLLPILSQTLSPFPQVEVIQGDILRLDLPALVRKKLGDDFILAANLPYYITTPVLMEFMRLGLPIKKAVVMVQREAAERIVASPSSKDYGVLSVAAQIFARCQICLRVPPGAFFPAPDVQSAVVSMDFTPRSDIADTARLFRLIKAAFAMRRKTLVNNLVASIGLSREEAAALLSSCGLPDDVRGEALPPEAFVMMSNRLTR